MSEFRDQKRHVLDGLFNFRRMPAASFRSHARPRRNGSALAEWGTAALQTVLVSGPDRKSIEDEMNLLQQTHPFLA